MRLRILSVLAVLALAAGVAAAQQNFGSSDVPPAPPIGSKMPAIKLATLTGDTTDLSAYANKNGLLVIFVSVQCPVSNAYNERMEALAQQWRSRGFGVVGVNANRTESAGAVAAHAREHGLTFPILKDNENRLADALGASFTPETYLFDASGTLRYHGRIDDSKDPSGISKRDLNDALESLATGKPVAVTETKAFGCTIKRVPRS
ncbi:MAG TPA: redoxin domain-containing protein [Candidatus Acidoferrales bacterium]|nr:redoxin domain-containing protein [Candidatus Acidoferrales bacterium]